MSRVWIALSASKGLVSWLIRKCTGSPYNHAFIIYTSDLFGGYWAVQIAERGVVKMQLPEVLKKYYKVDCYKYDYNLDKGLQATRHMINKGYDWTALLGFLGRLLWKKLTGRESENYLQVRNRLFCSEYTASVLKAASALGFESCTPSQMSPGDLYNILKDLPAFTRVDCPEG